MSRVFTTITPVEESKRFIKDCLKALGTNLENAEIVAKNLAEADYRGHSYQGMRSLDTYIREIKEKRCDPNATWTIEKETAATALVSANNGLGPVIGKCSMELAIEKARDVGIGLVAVHCSNTVGMLTSYVLQALERGMIGLCFTNTSPFMVPSGAKEAALGTNPLAMGAPGLYGDSFILDMTTTAVPMEKIEMAWKKGETIPESWAFNNNGQVETNPEIAYNAAKLMPLGGPEINYKGFGLGVMVEILCGILSGSKYGPHIKKWNDTNELADLGQCFIAINPKMFANGFETRMSDLIDFLRNMSPADPNKPVFVPGDPERIRIAKVNKNGGFGYVQDTHDLCTKLAKELDVKPMASICKCGGKSE